MSKKTWDRDFKKEKAWWGDQLSILKFIGPTTFFNRGGDFLNINGIQVCLFPAELYNYTDETSLNNMKTYESYPRIVHFRGMRKKDMLDYWEAFITSKV